MNKFHPDRRSAVWSGKMNLEVQERILTAQVAKGFKRAT